jgi:Na+-driven multidrug efflux pump
VFGKEEFDEVIALAIPALGSLLADPLMSLVDTAVVGRYSSTSLAALGPSTAVFQIVFQVRSS